MTKLINQTRVILISGSSHVETSTLGRSLAAKLSWNYLSTNTLARYPGRPWVTTKVKSIPEHVAQHYQTLSVEVLSLVMFYAKIIESFRTLYPCPKG